MRGLASEISINYNTVNKAYLSLVSDGYLKSTRGRGVFVRDLDAEMDEEYTKDVDGIMSDCVAACRDLGAVARRRAEVHDQEIKQIKKDEGLEPPLERGDGTARIVPVDVGGTVRKKQAGA